MRKLAAPFTTYLSRRKVGNVPSRNFSTSQIRKEEEAMEEEAEKKIGWFLKLLFAGTATAVAYQFFPYLGENLLQQSVSLLHVKDPLFKRMGASRLSRFAIDDDRRKKIIELGGAEELLNMLGDAKDDPTRKEALKALAALAPSDEAARFLHNAGAISVVRSTPKSSDAEIEIYKLKLLQRFNDLRHNDSSVKHNGGASQT